MAAESLADLLGMFSAEDFAVAATWISKAGGAPVAFNGLLETEEGTVFPADAGVRAARPRLRVPAESLTAGRPLKGDLISVSGGNYRIAIAERDPLADIYLLVLDRA
jgi:hypothetical protein